MQNIFIYSHTHIWHMCMYIYVCADGMTLRKDKHDIKKRYLYMCTHVWHIRACMCVWVCDGCLPT